MADTATKTAHQDLHSEHGAERGDRAARATNPVIKVESLAWLEATKLLRYFFVLVLFVVTFFDAAVHEILNRIGFTGATAKCPLCNGLDFDKR